MCFVNDIGQIPKKLVVEKVKLFTNHPFAKSLKNEISELGSVVVTDTHTTRGCYVNATCFFMLRRTGNALGLDNLTTGDIPAVDAMFIRVSNEKRSILPLIRSEMRG